MSDAVRCGRCRTRYRLQHEKCPRCGARVPKPIVEGAAAGTAREGLQRLAPWLAGSVILLMVLAVTASWIWARRVDAAPSVVAESAVPNRALQVITGSGGGRGRPTTGAASLPAVVPFMEAKVAGRQAYVEGDLQGALAQFLATLQNHPDDTEALNNAGQVLVRLGRPTEALTYLSKAASIDPQRWQFRFNLARVQGLLGDWNRAAAEYAEASRLFPDDYATAFNLAQALHRAGREEEAVSVYRQAIDLKSDDPTFYLALGISEEKLGHKAEAAAAYRRYAELDPSAPKAEAVRARAQKLEAPAATSETTIASTDGAVNAATEPATGR